MGMIYGSRLCGAIDRIPGLCYVSTKFAHLNFLPLLPLGTYIVWEGSERFESFRGKRIALSWTSLLVGYYRGWVGVAALFLFAAVGALTPMYLGVKGRESPLAVFGFVFGLVGGIVATAFVLYTKRRAWLFVALLLHGGSAVVWVRAAEGAKPQLPAHLRIDAPQEMVYIPWANLALLAYSSTRQLDRAGSVRAMQLGKELGLQAETVEDLCEGRIVPDTSPGITPHNGIPASVVDIHAPPDDIAFSDEPPKKKTLTSKYPLSSHCPACGSEDYRRVKAATTLAFTDDRVCKPCGTRYTPPTPAWGRAVLVVLGLGFLAVALALVLLPDDKPDYGELIMAVASGVVVAGAFLYKAYTAK